MCQISQFDELLSRNIGYSFQNQIVSPIGYILDKYNSFAAEMAGLVFQAIRGLYLRN